MSGVINNPGTKSGVVGSFDDVENTKLSTWAGTTNITTLGVVTAGTMDTGVIFDDPTITQGSDATGDTYYRAANGRMTRLAAGADGTVLTSTGAGAALNFEAAAGGGGAKEVSEAENTTGVTRTSQTAYNPGHYITFNPDSTSDMVFVNITFSWHDGSPNTAQGSKIYAAHGGGSYSEKKNYGDHNNHNPITGQYGIDSYSIARTAGQWGWSTGTLQFKHYVQNQDNNNTIEFGSDNGGGSGRTWVIQGVRYAADVVTAGGDSSASDFRLKYNIFLIQRATSSTPNLYMFKYKWDKFTNYVGVMAQELLDTSYSNAVHKESNGYYSVDYSKLGFPMMKISKALSLDKILSLIKGK